MKKSSTSLNGGLAGAASIFAGEMYTIETSIKELMENNNKLDN